jgi:hypothetical protein
VENALVITKKSSVGLIKKTPSPAEKILFIVGSLLWGYL